MRMLSLFLVFPWIATAALPQHLTVEEVKSVAIKAGAPGEIVVNLKVIDGFHVQANPASKPQLIATKVDLTSVSGVEVGPPVYPKPKPYRVPGLQAAVDTLDGKFTVRVPLTVSKTSKPGKTELAGKVRYQACDDKVCFPPTIAKFSAPVEITP